MSFVAYLVYMSLAFVRPFDVFWPDLEEYRPMLWLWLFAFGSALITVFGRRQLPGRPLYFALLGMLVVAIAISQAINTSVTGMFDAVSNFSASAMLFVLTCMNLNSMKRARTTCFVLVVCIVINAGMGIAAFRYGWKADQFVIAQGTDAPIQAFENPVIPSEDVSGQYLWRVRSTGFLNDPNDFGQVIVMALPLLWAFRRQRRILRNLILIGATAILLYALYLTYSRGALVGLGALLIFAARRRLGTVKMALLAAVLVFASSTANFGVGDREFSTKEESASERIEAWYAGLQMLKAKPAFGVGYGRFEDNHPITAHNSVVLCFSELGFFGYFFWGALLVLAFRELDQTVKLAPPGSADGRLAGLLLSALESFLVCAWFLSRTYQPTLYLLLAICACVAWCARNERAEAVDGAATWPPVSWLVPTLIANVAGIAAVYGFVTLSRLAGG